MIKQLFRKVKFNQPTYYISVSIKSLLGKMTGEDIVLR